MAVLLSGDSVTFRARTRPWLWFNLLSIDAPLVAVVWQLWFARCFRTGVAPLSVTALALAVWMIYAADRLLDVRHSDPAAVATERHRFHREHRRSLSIAVVFCFIILSFIAASLSSALLRDGLLLSLVVALYFAAVHFWPQPIGQLLPKELAVAVVFALGTAIAPGSRCDDPSLFIAPVVLFAFLCFLNCAAIEVWEWRRSGKQHSTPPHRFSLWFVQHLRFSAGCGAIAALLLLVFSKMPTVFAAIIISALAFVWLDAERERLPISLLRVLADVPLLSPLILLLGLH